MSVPVGEAPALRTTPRVGRGVLEWHTLITITILVIFFIPIRRFTLSGGFGFELEPYRAVVALVLLAWFISLLIDPRVRLRSSGVGLPLTLFSAAALGSIIVNSGRIHALALEGHILKQLMFFASYILMLVLIVSTIRTVEEVDKLLRVLVLGATVVAVTAVYEYWTHHNLYDNLPRVMPFLQQIAVAPGEVNRGGLHRTAASAEHPIALAAALLLLFPFSVYLAKTASRRWWLASGILIVGAFTTVSRTSLVMLAVVGLSFLCIRPRDVLKAWPWALPLLVATQFAVPGALGTFRYWIQKPSAVVVEQERVQRGVSLTQGDRGRLADIAPSLGEFSKTPFLGQGFGTRISDYDHPGSAQILDDQWLKSLLETGLLGAVPLACLVVLGVKRAARRARSKVGVDGWRSVAFTASLASYGLSMFVYDAFSFTQSTYLFFIVLALSCVCWGLEQEKTRPAGRNP
jgi:polysaccharide biosynthesis protein PslJ